MMSWKNDRDIEKEIKEKIERQQNKEEVWEPWGPLEWPDDYGEFEYYVDRLKTQSKYSKVDSLSSARSALLEFKKETEAIDSLQDLNKYKAEKFASWLLNEKNVSKSTRNVYIGVLYSLGEFYAEAGHFSGNPFSNIEPVSSGSASTSLLNNNRVDVSKTVIAKKIDSYGVKNTTTVIIITLAKTGIRVSELCNLNDKDLNLSNKIGDKIIDPRPELQGKPDTLFIDSNVDRENVKDDTNGNKRKVSTEIPIDNELKQLLTWYLLVRPPTFSDSSNGDPLFRSNGVNNGQRLTSRMASEAVIRWSKEVDLHNNGDEMDNVTAHWFRSFFTTELFQNADVEELNGISIEKFVKGLRGDVGDDVIDRYLQDGGDYRSAVVNNTPKFGIETNVS